MTGRRWAQDGSDSNEALRIPTVIVRTIIVHSSPKFGVNILVGMTSLAGWVKDDEG